MKNIAIKAFLFLASISLIFSLFAPVSAADATANIEGVLVDQHGDVMANETVTLSNSMTATTGSDGSFQFDNVTVGSYDLTVELEDGETFTYQFTAVAGENDLGEIEAAVEAEGTTNLALIIAFFLPSAVVFGIVFNILRKRKMKEQGTQKKNEAK
ncbi:MAG: carboxypeptidase-like regulatory domain-containing protein [Methanomassiliicoccales archaeon]|nr:carboxypeptidase-like regulatory domain-containing protein [Methanomassiliicoccales archaeon]